MEKKFGFFSSSVDSQKFSKFWGNLIPLVLVVIAYFKLNISEVELVQVGEGIVASILFFQTMSGLIRKFQKHEAPQVPPTE